MKAPDRCAIIQTVDRTGAALGPVRLRQTTGDSRGVVELPESLEEAGGRLRNQGWRLVGGDRVPASRGRRRPDLYTLILTYSKE